MTTRVYILVLNLYIALSAYYSSSITCQEFSPVTENVPFKAIFRIQTFIDGRPDSVSEVHEQYQHNLAASSVLLKRKFEKNEPEIRRYLYNGEARKDVEIELSDNNEIKSKTNLNSGRVRVLDKREGALDSVIFKFKNLETDEQLHLNLDVFLMTKICRDKINQKLHYVRGLSRLLHMIECRRTEFELDDQHSHSTRGLETSVYSANNIQALSYFDKDEPEEVQVKLLNVTVSIEKREAAEQSALPKRSIPLSMSLEFMHPRVPKNIVVIINLFDFEVVRLDEHLRGKQESNEESESIFLMPLLRGLDKSLVLDDASSRPRKLPFSFSFKASLTGDHLPLDNNPIELKVAYDIDRRILAREVSLINRNGLDGDDYKRHTTRTVYDYESGYKFHIKHQNNDYFTHYSHDGDVKDKHWNTCESDSVSTVDRSRLVTAGVSSAFELELAVYMGQAVVRGIPCNVYELELYALPIWLDSDLIEGAYGGSMKSVNEVHIIIYNSAHLIEEKNLKSQQEMREASEHLGKIVRLQVSLLSVPRLLPGKEEDEEGEIKILASFRLELHQFHWHVDRKLERLFEIGQDCLFSNDKVRYRDMELVVEPEKLNNNSSKLIHFLSEDKYLRTLSISRLLASSFLIKRSQQEDLETYLELGSRVGAKLTVYELPQSRINTFILGYALDESLGSAAINSWSFGATDISLEECKWRVAHTLKDSKNTFTSTGDHEASQVFMYCPKTLHCTIGDSSWLSTKGEPVSSKTGIFKYPAKSNIENKCTLMKLVKEQQAGSHQTQGRKLLDWLSYSRSKLLEEKFELKVNQFDDEEEKEELKVMIRLVKLTFSDIFSVEESNASQGLMKALQGVGYHLESLAEEGKGFVHKVSSVARCSQLCFMLYECLSYSVCHNGPELQCLLTRVNWTDSVRVTELSRMVENRKLSYSTTVSLKVHLRDSPQPKQVELRLSGLCSLHAREHFNIFIHKDSSLEAIKEVQYLIHSDSVQDCASFCIDRAKIFSSIKRGKKQQVATAKPNNLSTKANEQQQVKLEFVGHTVDVDEGDKRCISFKFSRESKTCELLPAQKLGELLLSRSTYNNSFVSGGESQQVIKWLNEIKKVRDRSRSLRFFDELETYELNYLQLFTVHPEIHLINLELEEKQEQDAGHEEENYYWSTTVLECGVEKCARLCLEERNCRSFDVMKEPKPGALDYEKKQPFIELIGGGSTCHLNGLSLADLIINNMTHRGLKFSVFENKSISRNKTKGLLKQQSSASDGRDYYNWWHYEPSELALHLMGNTADRCSSDDNSNYQFLESAISSLNSEIFIRSDQDLSRSVSGESLKVAPDDFGKVIPQEHSNVSSNQWPFEISHLLEVLLLIMLVVGLLYLATKS